MALKPELKPVIWVLTVGSVLLFFALSQGHQQNILGMSRQAQSVSIVSTKGRGGLAFL